MPMLPGSIAYFVHDLNDAAVDRRVRTFAAGGAVVRVAGFRRRAAAAAVAGAPVTDLGVTVDMDLRQRVRAVARHLLRRRTAARFARGAQTIVARNLEMLVIAAAVRTSGQRLVYECLDIHRRMLGTGWSSRILRAIEARLLRRCAALLTSSPAFVDHYFVAHQRWTGPVILVENKPVRENTAANVRAAPGSPWRIGWFGILRCRRSLAMLCALATTARGSVEIVIAGRVATTEMPDFDRVVAAAPHVRFAGPYRPADLAALYDQVHFAWVVDFYEEGLNSRWLLPNRLYEGLANGAVPLAQSGIEVSHWLARHGVGRCFDDLDHDLAPFLRSLGTRDYAAMAGAVAALPRSAVTLGDDECRAITAAVQGMAG